MILFLLKSHEVSNSISKCKICNEMEYRIESIDRFYYIVTTAAAFVTVRYVHYRNNIKCLRITIYVSR